MKKHEFHVPDMSCGHCVKRISSALEEEGLTDFEIRLETKTVTIETDAPQKILEALEEAGYPATLQE